MSRIKVIIPLIVTFALLLAACAPATQMPEGLAGTAPVEPPTVAPAESQSLTPIRLPVGYIPNVQFAPFYIAMEKGYYRDAGLEVTLDYSYETDGVALVGANQLQFAVVSGEQVLLARAQGLPVVYVTTWWQDYPVGIAALKDQGIRSPQDLKGKRIGTPVLFGASYVGLRALLGVAGLSEEEVTIETIGFNQVESLATGQLQAVVVYVNNEPIQLQQRNYEVDVVRVADHVHLASNGLITNETVMAENPDLVRRMAAATLKGIADAVADPDEAFEICKKYVEGLDTENGAIQKSVLLASVEFWKTDQPGVSDPAAWENMQTVLLDMGLLAQAVDLEKAYSNDFVK